MQAQDQFKCRTNCRHKECQRHAHLGIIDRNEMRCTDAHQELTGSSIFLENILDLSHTLAQIMIVCGVHECKAKITVDILLMLLNYDVCVCLDARPGEEAELLKENDKSPFRKSVCMSMLPNVQQNLMENLKEACPALNNVVWKQKFWCFIKIFTIACKHVKLSRTKKTVALLLLCQVRAHSVYAPAPAVSSCDENSKTKNIPVVIVAENETQKFIHPSTRAQNVPPAIVLSSFVRVLNINLILIGVYEQVKDVEKVEENLPESNEPEQAEVEEQQKKLLKKKMKYSF
ncbi:hypothetical protein EVAR_70601_1 [Eumeta japonica]|uniref:Uncharacterized protein n=1 Tax=Eumeta variegata TaxID=151549 RepID=A0A4C1T2G1_EUMVA|nr:hypothetical protein EVAR_70601_1 [Eumeta japonica]